MRVDLKGQGTPIPTIALPDPNIDPNQPATVLTFTENSDFSVTHYLDFGFTHFEAWCVGAAGGRGGDGTNDVDKVFETTYQSVPQDVWDLWIHKIRVDDYFARSGEWDHVYSYSGGLLQTAAQHEEYINPNHRLIFNKTLSVSLTPSTASKGAGSGGGGLHRVVGALVDLPSSVVPVVVGQAGVDAELGQVKQNGVWTPDGYANVVTVPPGYPSPPPEPSNWDWTQAPFRTYMDQLTNWFWVYTYDYPLPHASFLMPQPGGDGGASSFGDVCQASGGKGGGAGGVWNGSGFVRGNGGAGGVGGTLVAGGGGAGSNAEGVKGSDGIWLPETGIGQGGGGGKAGSPASSGGQGSYSFADTTVFGERQLAQQAVPGCGGGARPLANLLVGSKAYGYSPDGAVVVRLTKIV